jgi:hypothetical protein
MGGCSAQGCKVVEERGLQGCLAWRASKRRRAQKAKVTVADLHAGAQPSERVLGVLWLLEDVCLEALWEGHARVARRKPLLLQLFRWGFEHGLRGKGGGPRGRTSRLAGLV